jgi:membrane fusion protein, multidrug efflux system
VGQQDDVQAVITDGVVPGDKVVTTGFARLQDGSKVDVSAPAPAGADAAQQPTADNNGQQKPHRRHGGDQGADNAGGEGHGHRKDNGGNAPAAQDTTSAIPNAQQPQ